jgi:hypothetical protein
VSKFESDLREQLQLLEDYAALYDSRKYGHAKSISTRIAVIQEMLSSRDGGNFIGAEKNFLLSHYCPRLLMLRRMAITRL